MRFSKNRYEYNIFCSCVFLQKFFVLNENQSLQYLSFKFYIIKSRDMACALKVGSMNVQTADFFYQKK